MHLQCNQCAKHGVHEDANKQVFLLEGTSWCDPHHEEDKARKAEWAEQSRKTYAKMHEAMEEAMRNPGPIKTERIHIP